MEVILAAHLWSSDGANLKQLRKTRIDLVASGQRVEDGARVAEFLLDVKLGVGIVRIFEVAVAIDDFVPWTVSSTGTTLAFGGPLGLEGAVESPARESSAQTRATTPMRRIRKKVSKREPPSMNTSLLLWTRRRGLG